MEEYEKTPVRLAPTNTAGRLLASMLAFQGGQPGAFDVLYATLWKRVYFRGRKMGLGHEESEEIAQKVLVRVYLFAAKAHFEHDTQIWSWVYTIAVREVYKFWRHKRPEVISEEGLASLLNQPSLSYDDPAVSGVEAEILHDVGECLARLGEVERLYLLGPLMQSLKFRQAAAVHGLTLGQFKHRYEKALEAVRNCLKAKGHDFPYTTRTDSGEGD
jgi:RNA polymerase sigma factor (sigma-70 family)